jgi:prepilin-type N-terminal cleavage/methylation domain-containing protein
MRTAQFQDSVPVPVGFRRQAGVTLIEVLVALFITGVGLLALLTLFPLGVLRLSQEIQDDRAAKLALDAEAFSRTGEDLLARTREFIAESFRDGSADPQAAARLRAEFEELAVQAADLENRLAELEPLIQRPMLRLQLRASLFQIKAIQAAAGKMVRSLRLLEQPNPP